MYEVNNQLAAINSERLYLDSKTADVKFVFRTGIDHTEILPAHKIILSVGSSVFDAMFYGSLPEQGDIQISDTSPAAFKEFLQFFYKSKIHLSSEHIIDVTSLCKQYEVVDGLRLCEEPLQKSLSIEEMCSGYEFAIRLELTNTIQFCEQKIKQNAKQILKSASLKVCSWEILDKLLDLIKSLRKIPTQNPICSASSIVDAYMTWAEAECERKNVEKTPTNLKAKLGPTIVRIPFTGLTKQQFKQFMDTYNGFFNETELVEILLKIVKRGRRAWERVRDKYRCCYCSYCDGNSYEYDYDYDDNDDDSASYCDGNSYEYDYEYDYDYDDNDDDSAY